jgi:manO
LSQADINYNLYSFAMKILRNFSNLEDVEKVIFYILGHSLLFFNVRGGIKLAVSLNTKALFVTKGNFLSGGFGNKRGDILIGDRAFEFYNIRNTEDCIQIPWEEIEKVRAQIFFNDRYIRGFFIDTKKSGSFNFVVVKAGKSLKVMRDFLENEKIVRSKPLFSLKKLFRK